MKEQKGSKIHQKESPTGGYPVRYLKKEACESKEFPISDAWGCCIESESQPLELMNSKRELEIGYCYSGSGLLFVEDRTVQFSSGCISVIGSNLYRMSRAQDDTPSFWKWFWVDHRRLLSDMPEGSSLLQINPFTSPDYPLVFTPREHPRFCDNVKRIIQELDDKHFGYRAVVRGMTSAFVAELLRYCQPMSPGKSSIAHEGLGRISPALVYLTANYQDSIDIGALAASCQISVPHFRRLFIKAIGMPPMQYLARMRVRMAMAILTETERSISEVAFQTGFNSINTFNRQFLTVAGMTPRDWKNMQHRPYKSLLA